MLRRRATVWAVVALAFAFAWPMQGVGYNQNSHYALVKSLARGTASIERALLELGDLSTGDVILLDGRHYSNKAPGLALASMPSFLLLEAAGARTVGDPTQMLWALGLVGVVLPAVGLVLLVRRVGERFEPGFGTAAAVTLGLGTLLLPFATLYFSHALSAFLVFGAFALLLAERAGPHRPSLVAASGLAAGLAVSTEYPNALAGAVLGVYAVARTDWLARAGAYVGGVAVGLLPLVLYNRWAFGSIAHVSYQGTPEGRERSAEQLVRGGEFDPVVLLSTLFGSSGLITLSPVLVAGAAGTVLLWRKGLRAEALAIGGVVVLFLVYNASYGHGFGGYSAGERYLIPAVPFLAAPLALAFRTYPVTTGALALVSAAASVLITATHALAAYDGEWIQRAARRQFTPTAAALADVTGWYTILPFFAAAAAAVLFAGLASGRPISHPGDKLLAGTVVLAWALVAFGAPKRPTLGGAADEISSYGAAAVACAAALVSLYAVSRTRRRA